MSVRASGDVLAVANRVRAPTAAIVLSPVADAIRVGGISHH